MLNQWTTDSGMLRCRVTVRGHNCALINISYSTATEIHSSRQPTLKNSKDEYKCAVLLSNIWFTRFSIVTCVLLSVTCVNCVCVCSIQACPEDSTPCGSIYEQTEWGVHFSSLHNAMLCFFCQKWSKIMK